MVRSVIIALATLLVGTASGVASAEDTNQEFLLSASAAPLKLGIAGAIAIKIDVKPGFHWNDDYPAKLELTGAPDGVTLPKATLAQLAGDFKSETPTLVNVAVPAIAATRASGTITIDAHFSVCNERECRIKKATTTVQIVAQ